MDFAPECGLLEVATSFVGDEPAAAIAWHRPEGDAVEFPRYVKERSRPDSAGRSAVGSPGPVEFRRVYREGRRFLGAMLVLYVRPTDGRRRVGITAGRRFGGAVARNRAKRRLREAFRRLEGRLRDRGDLVLVARPPVLTAPFGAIVSEMEALCATGQMFAEGSSHEAGG